MSNHARLAPSSAARWIHCPGSVQLQEQYPDQRDKSKADEGTLAHSIAAKVLDTGEWPSDCNQLPNEMIDAIKVYIQAVRSVVGDRRVNVEHPVTVESIHQDCWGTPDAVRYDSAADICHVWDFKYGWGIVEAFQNIQLVTYALGLAESIRAAEFWLHIVQPRPFHPEGSVRTWKISRDELLSYLPQLQKSAESALSSTPWTFSGPHCRWCSALYACDTARRAAFNALDIMDHVRAPTPEPNLISFELSVLRRAADLINHRLAAVEETVKAMDKAGNQVPGWQVTHSAGRLDWTGNHEEIAGMGKLMGFELTKPALITPTQAISAGVPKDVVMMYADRKPGKACIEPVNNDKIRALLGGSL